MLPYGVTLIYLNGEPDSLIAAFVLFWASLLAVMARHLNDGFREGLTLSLQNAKLAQGMARQRDRADAASRAKTRFLGHMSHELRTPLNAIIGYAGMMEQKVYGPLGHANYDGYAADIETSGRHLLGMVEKVLEVTDLESGRTELSLKPLSVARALMAARDRAAEASAANRVSIALSTPAALPSLNADPDRLAAMLDELLSNAIAASPAGGSIRLAAFTRADGGIVIEIADDGPGMADDCRAAVLEPFGRLAQRDHRTAGGSEEGVGLGLPLVNLIARLHQGRLELSDSPSGGLAARLVFPPSHSVAKDDQAEEAA